MSQGCGQLAYLGEALLYLEGGEVQVARLVSSSKSKLRIVDRQGNERRLDRRKWVGSVAMGQAEQVISEAVRLTDNVSMVQVWELARGSVLDTANLAARCLPDVIEPTRSIALQLANSRKGGFFRIRGDSWEPVSVERRDAVLASQVLRKKQREREQQWMREIETDKYPEELLDYLDEYVEGDEKPQDKRHQFLHNHARTLGLGLGELAVSWGRVGDLEHFHLRELRRKMPVAVSDPGPVDILLDNLAWVSKGALAIDARGTVEVDDAFSVETRSDGQPTIAIHIAAPGLGMDAQARQQANARIVTTYLPGQKHFMLPVATVASYSLQQGLTRPCLSLVAQWDRAKGKFIDPQLVLGKIMVRHNLDIEVFSANSVALPGIDDETNGQLSFLNAVVVALNGAAARQRPNPGHLVRNAGEPEIVSRANFALADRMVAALMVTYNKFAAQYLAERNVPYLQRREGHLALSRTNDQDGYGWFTSPLRRLADLVNQEQLLAAMAGEAVPYTAGDLRAIIPAFNKRYSWIQLVQQKMETFWSLRWLAGRSTVQSAHTTNDPCKVRLDAAPVTVQVKTSGLPPGTKVKVRLDKLDEHLLQASGTLL